MNLMLKLICFVFVLGFAGLFVLKKPDGTPWLSTSDLMPDTKNLSADAMSLLNAAKKQTTTDSTATAANTMSSNSGVYRWKDEHGQWQFSDTPPAHIQAEMMQVTGDLNKDIAEKYTPPEKQEEASIDAPATATESSVLPTSLSPEKVSKLIKDANNIQQLMDDRGSQIESQLK